ncbi:hypothetical protein ILUMI_12398, partial [Ignelater luminosus]
LNACTEIKNQLDMEQFPDFATTVELCFQNGTEKVQKYATVMRRIVNIFLCLTQLGFCCVYIVFVASTTQQIFEWYGHNYNVQGIMAVVIIPIILSCLIRNLKYLAPVSALANVFLFIGAVMCMYYAIKNLEIHQSVKYAAGIHELPLFFGTALFAFEGIGTVIPLKSDMKDPPRFDSLYGVLNIGKCSVMVMYVLLGVLAYIKYGHEIQGSVTLNLPKDEATAQAVKGCTGFAIMFTYAIQFYVPFQILWVWILESQGPFKYSLTMEMGFRVCLVLLTFVLAEAIPYLDLFISLVGAFSSTALALLIPPVLEYVMASKTEKLTKWILFKDAFIFIVGVLGTITGTYESIRAIVNQIQNASERNANFVAKYWVSWSRP